MSYKDEIWQSTFQEAYGTKSIMFFFTFNVNKWLEYIQKLPYCSVSNDPLLFIYLFVRTHACVANFG